MSHLFFLIPHQLSIEVSSDADISFSDSEYLLLRGYVPGIVLLDTKPEKIDIFVQHTEANDPKIIQQENHIHIFDTWNKKFPIELCHVLYVLTRIQLLKQNLFSVHGACVGTDDGYVLVVGHSGNGKTSVVLELLKNKDTRIFSGNKTVVSFDTNQKLTAVFGTPTITVTKNDKNKLDDLGVVNQVGYWERYACLLGLGNYASTSSVAIKAIVIIRLNDITQELVRVPSADIAHVLYPYFLDVVNADVVVGDTVIVGTRPIGIEEYVVSHLHAIAENIPVYSMIGSSSFVSNEILKL